MGYKKKEKLTDKFAQQVEEIWKDAFPDASLFPVIGLPSGGNGVLTLTHTAGGPMLKINGLRSKSPLSNNALYSSEISKGQFLNLYEIMLPDIPGKDGEPSTSEIYVSELARLGLNVAGVHFHWWGSNVFKNACPQERGVIAVHHQNVGMDPVEFSARTIEAIQAVMPVIKQRTSTVVKKPKRHRGWDH